MCCLPLPRQGCGLSRLFEISKRQYENNLYGLYVLYATLCAENRPKLRLSHSESI